MKRYQWFILSVLCSTIWAAHNPFVPTWQQSATPEKAQFSGTISLHDVLKTWAARTQQSLLINDLPNPKLQLHLHPTPWSALIKTLANKFHFNLQKQHHIWQATPQPPTLIWYPLKYRLHHTFTALQTHLQQQCKTCRITPAPNDAGLWISAPPRWRAIITQRIQQIDQPQPLIHLHVTLIQVNNQWLNDWGSTWQQQHPNHHLNFWGWLTQTTTLTPHTLPMWFQQTALEHLLAAMQTQKTGHLIAQAHLVTENRHATHLSSGVIVPYYIKDSRNRTRLIFKPITLDFNITPTLQNKHRIQIQLTLTHNRIAQPHTLEAPAMIQTQQINTKMHIKPKQTVLLSSLNADIQQQQQDQLSLFAHLPIIGPWLAHDQQQHQQQRLLMMMSATTTATKDK